MLRKELSKKILCCFIAITIIFNNFYMHSMPVMASENMTVTSFVSDGVEYVMYATENNGERSVEVLNTETKDKFEASVTKDFSEYKYEEYEYKGRTWFGASKYKKTEEISEDLTKYRDDDKVEAQYSWSKKKKDGWSKKYWYQAGASSYGNEYMKIGCVASYRIPVYKLSDAKQKKCKSYQEDIKDSIEYRTLSIAALAGTGLGFDVLVTVIAALGVATLGVGAIVTIVVALVGVGGNGVVNAVKCYKEYLNIEDTYAIIKTYGTKL
ncbi:MAG: hypothetical protein E7270_00120 [Lachnospiraceae bacterium]|nr:hypothetical protein [Lachnospiraceae bacterium]